jgi:hypothetical protein
MKLEMRTRIRNKEKAMGWSQVEAVSNLSILYRISMGLPEHPGD